MCIYQVALIIQYRVANCFPNQCWNLCLVLLSKDLLNFKSPIRKCWLSAGGWYLTHVHKRKCFYKKIDSEEQLMKFLLISVIAMYIIGVTELKEGLDPILYLSGFYLLPWFSCLDLQYTLLCHYHSTSFWLTNT